jgi:hypothetical protein
MGPETEPFRALRHRRIRRDRRGSIGGEIARSVVVILVVAIVLWFVFTHL